MSLHWADIVKMKLPITVIGGIVSAAVTAFLWADDVEDKQLETQNQLDKLVTIVTATTLDNQAIHQSQNVDLIATKQELQLLQQEIELRRELEAAADDDG